MREEIVVGGTFHVSDVLVLSGAGHVVAGLPNCDPRVYVRLWIQEDDDLINYVNERKITT